MGQSASRACCSGSKTESLELEPYGDISGVGVIIGFVGTGYLVLLLMILGYLVSYDPTQSPWPGQEDRYRWRANPIDVVFLRWIRRIKPTDPEPFRGPASKLQRSIDKSLLGLCDVQLVTGLGILTCAFILGLQCQLDAYHWQMAVHLAWFSVVTHLSGLFALRNRIAKDSWPKYARVGIMFSLLAILVVATIPTIYFNWAEDQASAAVANSTAICFLDLDYGAQRFREVQSRSRFYNFTPSLELTHQFQAAIFSIILLLFGFTTRLIKLFGVLSRSSTMFIRSPLSSFGKSLIRKVTSCQPRWPFGLWDTAVQQPLLAIFIMLRIMVNLASSMLAEVYWLLCVVLWGNVKLISTRKSAGEDIVEEEDEWTFGQILPVLLLVGPFIAISSTIATDFYQARYPIHYAGISSSVSISLDSLNDPTQSERDRGLEQIDADGATQIIVPTEATPQDRDISRISESHYGCTTQPSHQDLEFWLDPEASMGHPWIAISSSMPSITALAVTFLLFIWVYFFFDPQPSTSLYDFWISRYGILYVLLFDVPAACTGTVLVALRLNPLTPGQPRNFVRRFIFLWFCFFIYSVFVATTIVATVLLLLTDVPEPSPLYTVFHPPLFPFVKVFFIYILYVILRVLFILKSSAKKFSSS